MAQTAAIVSALKNALKEQGITYQQVAEALDLSGASVKRLFSERQFSLQRLDQICSLLGLEISDLVRRLDQAQRIDALTTEQEQELVGDDRLLLVAICALNRWSLAQILETYQLSEVEAVGRLVLDPLSATIFSSDPDTYAAIHTHVENGMPLDKAIALVAGVEGEA